MNAFGLYVHWPFCKAKCPYCDFNSHVRHGGVDAMRYARALAREIETTRQRLGPRTISSIFFGGGTPSLMPPDAVGHVLEAAAENFSISPDAEITLEANPTSVEAEHFRGYRSAGVNRVSVGVQALNQDDLAVLGRQHTPEEALMAFRLAAKIFPRASFDMIYARPRQTLSAWKLELAQALQEQQGHMSLYQLTIEPETRFADLYNAGRLPVPDEDLSADLFDLTQELTDRAGLTAYEVSNHAAAAQQSQHNLLYWRYGEYAGVGPGAHGRLHEYGKVVATVAEKHPERWLSSVENNGHGLTHEEVIPPEVQAREMLLMGLRISEGVSLSRYVSMAGRAIPHQTLAMLADLGMLTMKDNDRLTATPRGRRVLNAVIAELVE